MNDWGYLPQKNLILDFRIKYLKKSRNKISIENNCMRYQGWKFRFFLPKFCVSGVGETKKGGEMSTEEIFVNFAKNRRNFSHFLKKSPPVGKFRRKIVLFRFISAIFRPKKQKFSSLLIPSLLDMVQNYGISHWLGGFRGTLVSVSWLGFRPYANKID